MSSPTTLDWIRGQASAKPAALPAENPPVSGRPRRVLAVLLAVWMLNAYDLWMTLEADRHGLLVELNPVAATILPGGTTAIILYKLSLVTLGSTLLVACRRHRASEYGAWTTLLVYGLLTTHWFECWVWYSITLESGGHFSSATL
jgi:hypothetical protein